MAQLFIPQPPDPELPVFFNVDGVVGDPPAQNKREDVLLVQFLFNLLGNASGPTRYPDMRSAAQAVRVTGTIDSATITAIRTLQGVQRTLNPRTVVDGRVSPARGFTYGALWSIVQLNNYVQDHNRDTWPRIDKYAGCPDEIKQLVTRTLVGT